MCQEIQVGGLPTGGYGRCAPECGFLRVSSIAPTATVGAEGMEALCV